jgi:hypothetical protein
MLAQPHSTSRPAVERLASDIGWYPGTVRDLFAGPAHALERLKRALTVLAHDPRTVRWDRRIGRDMVRMCSEWAVRRRCTRWLKLAERRVPSERVEPHGFSPTRSPFRGLKRLGASRA